MLPCAMLHVQAQCHHVETTQHCRLSQIENLLLMYPWNSWNSCSRPSILTMHHTMCASNLMAFEPIYMNGKWFLRGGYNGKVVDIYLPELSLRWTIRPRATSGEKKWKNTFWGWDASLWGAPFSGVRRMFPYRGFWSLWGASFWGWGI